MGSQFSYLWLSCWFSQILLERCGYQLTPDGHRVVLLGYIRTPYCRFITSFPLHCLLELWIKYVWSFRWYYLSHFLREGRIDCLCPTCSSECLEHNTLKIVQIEAGYVSVLVKVRTIDSLQCLLVCEPNHLVAAGESGILHLWTMDPTWRWIFIVITSTLFGHWFFKYFIRIILQLPGCNLTLCYFAPGLQISFDFFTIIIPGGYIHQCRLSFRVLRKW